MDSFDIKGRFTGGVKFTAKIDCSEYTPESLKVGLAVKWAIANRADLSGADLYGADLSGADLSGANLSGVNLDGADLYGAKNIISFGPVGGVGRVGVATLRESKTMVQLGCFWGTEKEALAAIRKKYGPRTTYAALVKAACAELRGRA